MKKNYIVKVTGLLIVFILSVFVVTAQQTGRIAGKVTDKKSGEALIGLTVKVEGANKGVSTDVEGRYNIGGLAAGRYTLTFSYVGYQTKRISDIAVRAGAVSALDLVMDEAGGQQLQQVVITASARQESVGALYAQQKNSISISSGISAEQIRRSPDRNTSDVLRRVSGASIQENKFIVVRGLADRYNSAMLNNSTLPNTEPDKKAFSFDILPSNLIDKIVVNKSASADLPGDFSGGVVQISTKDFPDSKFLNLSVGTSYNTQSTFKDFIGPTNKNKALFGSYDKGRDLPSSFPSKSAYTNMPLDQQIQEARKFSNNWGPQKYTSIPSPILQLSYGDSKVLKNDSKFGAVLSLSYRYDERLQKGETNGYVGQSLNFEYSDNLYNYNTNIGALANFAYSWGTNKLALKNIYNKVVEQQFTSRSGVEIDSYVQNNFNYLLERSLVSSQLLGDHALGSKLKLDWNLNYASTKRAEPGFKRLTTQSSTDSPDGPYKLNVGLVGSPTVLGDFYSNLDENIYGGAANFTVPVSLFKQNSKLKFGYSGQYRDRNFGARVLGYTSGATGDVSFDTSLQTYPQDQLFNDENIRVGGFLLQDITNGTDHYDGSALLNAGYAMFDGFISEKLRLGIGARFESYHQKLASTNNNNNPLKVDTIYNNILPSVNLIFNASEKSSIRMSASRTVGRPEFREIAPFSFYDHKRNANVTGSPVLRQSSTNNFDLGYAVYPKAGEVISVSAFYKYFEDPIEQSLDFSSGRSFSYWNAPTANLYGVEFEVRKNLDFINEILKNLTFSANASYIDSRVEVSKVRINKDGERPLQGQSPYLINAGLQYNSSSKNPLGLSLLYNTFGRRIVAVGNINDIDLYEKPRNVLDFQISKKLSSGRSEIKLNYGDILNNKYIEYQDVNDNGKYDKGDNLNRSYTLGSTFTLGFSYNL